MHRSILLFTLALTGCGVATTPAASAAPAPTGELKVNMGCFESYDMEESLIGSAPGWSGAPAPSVQGAGRGSRGAGAAPRRKQKPSAAPPPAADSASMPEAEPSAAPSMEMDDRQDRVDNWEKKRPAGPSFDWGGETWLSNDDSMSLASAQRVLWAVDNGRRVSTSEVRPHELLNYFSFDTDAPTAGETFEVTASAEQHGDSLAVALAVQGASPPRQPLDLTVVVDRSCSMSDEGRMDYTKRGLSKMTEQLDKGDRIDVVLFDDAVCTPLENFVVGRDDPSILRDVIAKMKPEGGTDMDLGLREGYAVAARKKGTHHRNRRVMAITDALLNTGDINPNTVSEIGRKVEAEGIRLTGIGVGRDFNDDVLNKLTEKGKGAYVYLGSEAVVDRVFGSGFDALVQTIAHDVRFKLDLPDSLALERFYGEEASTNKEDIQPIHYYAGTSQVFLQDLKIRPSGVVRSDKIKLEVEWRDAQTGEPEHRVFYTSVGQMLDADPHNVRKARSLMAFSDVLIAQGMGADPCGEPLSEYGRRASGVSDDAEIGYVSGLVNKLCPAWEPSRTPPRSTASVQLKVKVDSDIPIAEVEASCSDATHYESLSGSDTVARFEVAPGSCRLIFQGAVPMSTTVEVAETGSDVRCLVRGGRLECS